MSRASRLSPGRTRKASRHHENGRIAAFTKSSLVPPQTACGNFVLVRVGRSPFRVRRGGDPDGARQWRGLALGLAHWRNGESCRTAAQPPSAEAGFRVSRVAPLLTNKYSQDCLRRFVPAMQRGGECVISARLPAHLRHMVFSPLPHGQASVGAEASAQLPFRAEAAEVCDGANGWRRACEKDLGLH